MTYAAYESSVESGTPLELYVFATGSVVTRLVTSESNFTLGFDTYTASAVKRDRVKQSSDPFKDGLRVSFPRGDEFASQFIGVSPDAITTLTIYRGHYGDPDAQFQVYWKGRVIGARATENEIGLDCESVFTSIQRPGLRAKFEYGCRHTLYGTECRVSSTIYRHVGSVLITSTPTVIDVSGADTYAAGYFNGGMLIDSFGTPRGIVSHSGTSITLTRQFVSLPVGAVTLHPGCDHLKETCNTKFNNLDNFGGFPYIPSRNPFNGSSIL